MKIKFLTLTALITLILFAGESYASRIPITGTAYSEEMGILHFDYKTAVNPGDNKFNDTKYYKGPKKQFYIDPYEDAKVFGTPGTNSRTVHISTDENDCNEERCFIKGFIWNDAVGWTALDGKEIGSGISSPGTYTEKMYPQVKLKATTGTRRHAITGYIWNKHTGWISLSSNNNGITKDTNNQGSNNWGLFIDFNDPVEKVKNEYGNEIKKGRRIQGYAWSEKLGWIKFSKDPIMDNIGFNFGAYTTWEIDNTAPISLAPEKVWFAVGINTGYEDDKSMNPTTILWKNVAFDYESGINTAKTKAYAKKASGSATDCPDPSVIIPTSDSSGMILNLTMPTLGIVKSAKGYCKYELHAEIVNNNNKSFYIGREYKANPDHKAIDVYVRAGNLDKNKSKITWGKSGSSAIADGKAPVQYNVAPKDIAGNPILNIACRYCPNREVALKVHFENEMLFDLTRQAPSGEYQTPLNVSNEFLKSNEKSFELRQSGISYPLEFTSYAPSSTYSSALETNITKPLKVTKFDYDIKNDNLPATFKGIVSLDPIVFKKMDEVIIGPEKNGLDISSVLCSDAKDNEVYSCPTFTPAITTSDPKLTTNGLENVISLGTPTDLQFTVNNFSIAEKNTDLSIDNVFSYASLTGNSSAAIMETQRITNISKDETDSDLGWTDPFEPFTEGTRYEMYMKGGNFQEDTTPFPDFYKREFHDKFKFYFNGDGRSSDIRKGGIYLITGQEGIPIIYKADDKGTFPDGQIDRSDAVNLSLGQANKIQSNSGFTIKPATIDKKIQFTPQKFLTSTIKDVKLGLVQDIAYRFRNKDLPVTIYRQSPLISLDVREIGMEAIGTVSGSKNVIDRQFNTVGTAGSYQIKEQMRRNVAKLTANIKTDNCKITNDNKTLSSLSTSVGDCVIEDKVNGTMFAYYEGGDDDELTLSNNSKGIELPEKPYTIIIKGGANLVIKENLYYPSSSDPTPKEPTSFGIIMIPGNDGKGSNVYISPDPTNIAAVLYTEGSVLSRSNSGKLYYGGGKGEVKELSNQLFWLGSIASRNTIAGTAQKKKPEGIDCLANDSELDCAKRYDFDYLRRFTTSITKTATKIANDGKFSGGGDCNGGTCKCKNCKDKGGPLPTVIKLKGSLIDKDDSELAPFFVKKDPGTLSSPPPGFTVIAGLESKQEIR